MSSEKGPRLWLVVPRSWDHSGLPVEPVAPALVPASLVQAGDEFQVRVWGNWESYLT